MVVSLMIIVSFQGMQGIILNKEEKVKIVSEFFQKEFEGIFIMEFNGIQGDV